MENDIGMIRQILEGDPSAFGVLVGRYQNYVFSICLRVLKNREEAEEAAQDTFMKVYRTLATYEQKSKFSTWLYTIAYRSALDKARKKKRHALPLEATEGHSAPLQVPGDHRAQPDQRMDEADLQKHLEKAVQMLPPDDAAILTFFYLHELSVKEISEVTGLTETNIKTKLHRLRDRLKTKLNHYLEAEIKDLI